MVTPATPPSTPPSAPASQPKPSCVVMRAVNAALSSGQGYLYPDEVERLNEALELLCAWLDEAMPAEVARQLAEKLTGL